MSLSTLPTEPFFGLLNFGVHERVRSLLSMRSMLLWYGFESRSNSRALAINNKMLGRKLKQHKWKKERKKENEIDKSRSLGLGDLKGWTLFKQSCLFSSLLNKKKEALLVGWSLWSRFKYYIIFHDLCVAIFDDTVFELIKWVVCRLPGCK